MIAATEFVRLEREKQQKQSSSNGHAGEMSEPEIHNIVSVKANIKSAMQLFVKCSAAIILDGWSENNRYSYFFPPLVRTFNSTHSHYPNPYPADTGIDPWLHLRIGRCLSTSATSG